MKKILLTAILFLALLSGIFAQDNNAWADKNNPISTVVPSLTIAPDARGGGMGDIGAATSPDVNNQYWNPAKYVFMESQGGVSLSYTPWLRSLVPDIDLAFLSGYFRFTENQSVSASLRYFSLGDITLMDQFGYPQGTAHPLEMAIDAAYALKFSENFSGSVALRFIYSDLNNGYNGAQGEEMVPGLAVAADIAAYYRLPIEFGTGDGSLAFGTNISNIGSKVSYDRNVTNNFIPTNWRLGASFEYPIDDYQTINISADANKLLVPTPNPKYWDSKDPDYNPNYYNSLGSIAGLFRSFADAPGGAKEELREIMWSAGAEYSYNKQFFVRAGYFNESKYKGNRKYFTFGAGFKLSVLQLDAGYVVSVAQSNPLDNTLRISLSFDVEGLKNLFQ